MIVVVDDDAAFLAVMEEWLTSEGYPVVTTRQRRDALALIRQQRPAVLILDVHLQSRAAGLDLLQAIRADPATRDVPVIVLSADIRALHLYESLLFQLKCDVVPKPFDLATLLTLIETRIRAGATTAAPGMALA